MQTISSLLPPDKIYINFFLVNLGKFFDTAVFQQCYIYTSELMPTSVRNIAVGTSSMFARIGCVLTPYVIELLVRTLVKGRGGRGSGKRGGDGGRE